MTYKAVDLSIRLDWSQRAELAHYNALEDLVPFTAFLIVVHFTKVNNEVTETVAIAFSSFVRRITFFTPLGYHLVEC